MTQESKKKSIAQDVSTIGGFIAGGIAACGAVTFTNPIELIKTRMQLQGEFDENEGLRGLQQGLLCGYVYQLGLNGCRIGFYEPSRYYLTKIFSPSKLTGDQYSDVPQNLLVNVVAGFGNLYKGPVDCFAKTIKIEGPTALYKGFWAQLFRVGPHSILTLMFMEQSMKLVHAVEQRFKSAYLLEKF
ncbi:Mitochondrial oxaloacetate carrier protein [Candidozyma auris]